MLIQISLLVQVYHSIQKYVFYNKNYEKSSTNCPTSYMSHVAHSLLLSLARLARTKMRRSTARLVVGKSRANGVEVEHGKNRY